MKKKRVIKTGKLRNRAALAQIARDREVPSEMMSLAETCVFFGGKASPIDRSTFYRGVRSGLFPKPVKIGSKMSRWRLSDCQAALARMQEGNA